MDSVCRCVVFDCDGVLVDSVSSWKTLHDGFGTDNSKNLSRFIAGEISDVEFMRSDIAMWKAIRNPIHEDELFRMYSGIGLMKGARETVQKLQDAGIYVAIVSAGVDLFVSSIAAMLNVDDWIANGFEFDKDGYLTDNGVCRLHASGKGDVISRLMQMLGFFLVRMTNLPRNLRKLVKNVLKMVGLYIPMIPLPKERQYLQLACDKNNYLFF